MILSEAIKNAVCLRKIVLGTRIKADGSTHIRLIFVDNQRALKLAENPVFHAKSKHNIRHHFIQELVEKKKLFISLQPEYGAVADILTKVTKTKHSMRDSVGFEAI